MAREIPEVVRAVAGLTATVLDEARNLPRSLFGLPVRLLGMAMQTSLKLQQQYSGLVARGDEVFTGLWGESEPGLATFDEDLPATPAPAPRTANRGSAFDRAAERDDGLPPGVLTEEALTQEELGEEELTEALVEELAGDPADLTVELSDEIADLSEGSELADVAGLADLEALADGDLPEAGGTDTAVTTDDDADDAPLADVLAFETMVGDGDELSDAQVAGLPADPPADTVTETVDELAAEVDAELAAELPESVPDEVADDLAADTVATVADAEVADGGSPLSVPDEATVRDLGLLGTADATEPDIEIPDLSLPEPSDDTGSSEDTAPAAETDSTGTADSGDTSDSAATAETGTASGSAAIEGIVADDAASTGTPTIEGISADHTAAQAEDTAAPAEDTEAPAEDTAPATEDTAAPAEDTAPATEDTATPAEDTAPPAEDTATSAETTSAPDEAGAPDDAAGGSDVAGSEATGTAPVEGYDGFSIPSLRGHLRSYPAETVTDLLDYERATRARTPYITLLQNRLEKLSADRG